MKTYSLLVLLFFFYNFSFAQIESDGTDCETGIKAMNEGKFQEAILAFENCFLEAEKEKNYSGIAKIFSKGLGECNIKIGQFDTAILHFNKAIEVIQNHLDGDHETLGSTYSGLGFCYSMLGEIKQAEEYSLKGVDFFRKKDLEQPLAVSLSNLAGLYLNIGKYEKCIKYGSEAISRYNKLDAVKNEIRIAFAEFNIGLAYSNLNQLIKSEKHAMNMMKLIQKDSVWGRTYLPHAYLLMGQNHANLNENELAIEYFQKIISMCDEQGRPDDLQAVLSHYHLGQAYARQNHHDKAIQAFEKAFKLAPDYLLGDSFLAASFYTGVCRSYSYIKDYEKALEYGNLSLEKYKEFELESDYHHIQLLIELIFINSQLNNFSEAEILFEETLKLLNNSTHNFTNHYSNLFLQKAKILASQKNNKEASYYFEQSLAYICEGFSKLSEEEITCSPSARNLADFEAVYKQADFFAETSNEIVDLNRAINQCSLSIEKAERLNANRAYKNQKNLYFTLNALTKSGQKNALKLYAITQSIKTLETAFFFVDYQKSIDLQKALESAEALKYANIPDTLLFKEKELRRKLFINETILTEAIEDRDSAKIIHYRDDIIFDLNREYQLILKKISNHSSLHNTKMLFQSSLNNRNIQQIIEEKDLLIEYAINEENKELNIFIIKKNQSLLLRKISLQKELSNQIKSFNKLLRKSTMARTTSREKFIKLSHELYQQFIEPIEDQLAGKERLIIIGDGMTNYIPFEVLLKSNESKPFTELDYLVKHHEISYHYSATLFAKTKEKEITDNTGIYAFAPVYEDGEGNALALRKRDQIVVDTTLRAFDVDGNYQPLPESEKEVKSIIELFKNNGTTNTTLALREDATENSLKTNLENPFKFIHIAGHSFADLENPKFSGIACFEETKESVEDLSASREDGTLYTGEIYNISTKADLVTLSSCESGFGKLEKTEGLLGLNRAFIYAGTPNVVFSLWKIYDKVSAELMVDFYQEILKGKSYSAALRAAKLKLLEKETTASPHFWSPFLLIGR